MIGTNWLHTCGIMLYRVTSVLYLLMLEYLYITSTDKSFENVLLILKNNLVQPVCSYCLYRKLTDALKHVQTIGRVIKSTFKL